MSSPEQRIEDNFAFTPLHLPPPPECCCGQSVQTGSKIIAIFCLFGDILNTIALIIFLDLWFPAYRRDGHEGIVIGLVVYWGISILVDIVFNTLLLRGVQQVNVKHCRLWIGYAKFLIGLYVCATIIFLLTMRVRVAGGQLFAVAKYYCFLSVVDQFITDVEAYPARYKNSNVQHV